MSATMNGTTADQQYQEWMRNKRVSEWNALMYWFRGASSPATRVSAHLLDRDLHELYQWVYQHPETLVVNTIETPAS
jgi:hypothetical protein